MDNHGEGGCHKPMAAIPQHRAERQRMAQVPGIYFGTEATGRVAKVQGTGLGVWEVIRIYRAFNGDLQAIAEAYPYLTRQRLQAALCYAQLYPQTPTSCDDATRNGLTVSSCLNDLNEVVPG